jgi:hypothetical protein
VTVTGIEATNKATAIEPDKATEQGVATIAKLAPGRYAVKAEFAASRRARSPTCASRRQQQASGDAAD